MTILETGGGVSCRETVYHTLENALGKWNRSWNGCNCHIIYLSLVMVLPLSVGGLKLCIIWGTARFCLGLSWPARSCCSSFCCYNCCLMTGWLLPTLSLVLCNYLLFGLPSTRERWAYWIQQTDSMVMRRLEPLSDGRGWESWDIGRSDLESLHHWSTHYLSITISIVVTERSISDWIARTLGVDFFCWFESLINRSETAYLGSTE